ncbi:hypothetical protein [Plastoroseomonas hellenica]|uniref:hypothetical protein n=1 Tax=Plastoroseomonas hellenica TaxID=2687306 RepID=UPI001BA7EA0F|nr:hypothetical protein [Plastoroseomonas hellenica]MBR0643474.1 hypothetical protein [Plastoroseomonas hellenica]
MTPVTLTARDVPPRRFTNDPPDLAAKIVGDRTPGDFVTYPDDDLAARMAPDGAGVYSRKNGDPL